jgi:hypothetical protein
MLYSTLVDTLLAILWLGIDIVVGLDTNILIDILPGHLGS